MYKKRNYRKAQGMLEYAILIAIVISAIVFMSAYVKRAYSGRIKADAENISQQLYSPRHTTSTIETEISTQSATYTGMDYHSVGNTVEVPDGVTLTRTSTTVKFDKKEAVDAFAAE